MCKKRAESLVLYQWSGPSFHVEKKAPSRKNNLPRASLKEKGSGRGGDVPFDRNLI